MLFAYFCYTKDSICFVIRLLAQIQESHHAANEKERQLAVAKQELQAFRFDQATRELEKQRQKEVQPFTETLLRAISVVTVD